LALDLGEERVHFVPGSAAIHLFDQGLGARRVARSEDVIALIRLVETLPQYAAQSTALISSDVPMDLSDRYRLYLALKHGRKPIITGTFTPDGFASMYKMLQVIRGGEVALAEKPLAIFDCCPSSPLRWSPLTCQALLDCARARIPVELVPMPMAGATGPVTLREAVVLHCAEALSGIVLTQLACAGAPVIYGGAASSFDMRQGSAPMGAIETMMIQLGCAQIGKHFSLPTHGYFGVSDAKTADYQAGMESGMGVMLAALAGINVVSGPGMLDYLLTQSLEKLALDHEACAMALRLVRGIAILPTDFQALIQDLVTQGELLAHPHTLEHWRQELGLPSTLLDRDTYAEWESKGALSAQKRASRLVQRRRQAPENTCPLPQELDAELEALMSAEFRHLGLTLPPGPSLKP
jgi:trimethylamine--corrinoid protein Co-methyltransferase